MSSQLRKTIVGMVAAAVAARKRIDPSGKLWSNVLASTGQPRQLG